MTSAAKIKIALFNSVLVRGDAISNSLRDKVRVLLEDPCLRLRTDVRVYAHCSDYDSLPLHRVNNAADVLFDPFFCSADVHIFEFGIYSDIFNAIFCCAPGSVKIAHYHNITPPQLLPIEKRALIFRSLEQKANLLLADHIFCDSSFNMHDLLAFGVKQERLSLLHLPVSLDCTPGNGPGEPASDDHREARFLYVGRFVHSKGLLDLVNAAARLEAEGTRNFRIRLVGNMLFSSEDYVSQLRTAIAERRLNDRIEFIGSVSDEELARNYCEADALVMPSYHEGFCVPVLEALSHGCYVISYDAGSLCDTVNGLGCLVPTGSVEALAGALSDFCRTMAAPPAERQLKTGYGAVSTKEFHRRASQYGRSFTFDAFALQFSARLRNLIPALSGEPRELFYQF